MIATGAKPMEFGFGGAEQLVTSEVFLELDALPRRIAFLGGGFISCEFAHVVARAGTTGVRILEALSRPLRGFDPDLVGLPVEAGWEIGVEVTTDAEVEAVETRGDRVAVRMDRSGREESFETDMVVRGGGRVPRSTISTWR